MLSMPNREEVRRPKKPLYGGDLRGVDEQRAEGGLFGERGRVHAG